MGKKKTLPKASTFGVFELLPCQNAKMPAKHTLWENIITLPKTCSLSVFSFLESSLHGGTKEHYVKGLL